MRYVTNVTLAQPVMLDAEHHWIDAQVVSIEELEEENVSVPYSSNGAQPGPDVIRVFLHIPYSDSKVTFTYQPNRLLSTPNPQATVLDGQ